MANTFNFLISVLKSYKYESCCKIRGWTFCYSCNKISPIKIIWKIQLPVLGLNKGYKPSEAIWAGYTLCHIQGRLFNSESSKCYDCRFARFSLMLVTFYIKENWLVSVLEGAQSVLVDESVAWELIQHATCQTRTTLPIEVTAVVLPSIVILPWKWVSIIENNLSL